MFSYLGQESGSNLQLTPFHFLKINDNFPSVVGDRHEPSRAIKMEAHHRVKIHQANIVQMAQMEKFDVASLRTAEQ